MFVRSYISAITDRKFVEFSTGADLGFYKGGFPIHLKGAPPIFLTHVTGTKQFFGLRRNNSVSYTHLTLPTIYSV